MRRRQLIKVPATVSAVATLAIALLATPILVDPAGATSGKITICHRTHSTTNPYRRITVSQNAVTNSRHGGHTVPSGSSNPAVYDSTFTYASNNKFWGDVIPGSTNGGSAYNGSNGIALNWTTMGIADFGNYCAPMTATQFYNSEIAAGQTAAAAVADLNEQLANEDAALLASIGGTFTVSNVSSWDTAVSVTTSAASSVAPTSATLNGSITVGSITTAIGFDYGTDSALAAFTSVSAGSAVSNVTGDAITKALSGLTSGTTYYFRATATTNAGTDTEGILYGSVLSFTTTGSTSQTITFDQPSDMVLGSGTQTLTHATANTSGLAVTFTSTTTGVCTVAGAVVTAVSAGTCSITASQAGNSTYAPATPVTRTLTVTAVGRTLAIDAGSYTATYLLTDGAPTVTSTASAGDSQGTKTYSSSTPSVCTIDASSGVVTFVAAGTCTIGAAITAGGNYGAATASNVSFAITSPTPTSRTLTIDASSHGSAYAVDATPPTITSTASAGDTLGTKSYSSSTPAVCTIDTTSGLVTFVAPGTCTIGAAITAAGGQGAATAPAVSFSVTPLARSLAIDSASYASGGYHLDAAPPTITSTPTAGSGAKGYSSSTPAVCTFNTSSGLVAFVSTGTCTIGASIAAAGNYGSATAAPVSFAVTAAAVVLPPVLSPPAPPAAPTDPSAPAPGPSRNEAPPAPDASAVVSPSPAGTITGIVWFDRNRNGSFDGREWILPGIEVTLVPVAGVMTTSELHVAAATPVARTTTTDARGRYAFTDLPFGAYVVSAVAHIRGFDYTSDTDGVPDWRVTAAAAADRPGVADFAGLGRGEIVGQMFEQRTGDGLAQAQVSCTWGGYDDVLGTSDDLPFTLVADDEGHFDMRGIPYGNFKCDGVDVLGRHSTAVMAAVFSPDPQRAPLPVGTTPELPRTGVNLLLLLVVALSSFALGGALTTRARRLR